MGLRLPTDPEIRARAEEMHLLEPGADLPSDVRRKVAALLLAEQQAPASPPPDTGRLLSRFQYETGAGVIRVDVTLIPNPDPEKEHP